MSVNFWVWLVLIVAPVCVFAVGPQASVWLRVGRLLFAIGATYVLLNLALHTHNELGMKAYEQCKADLGLGWGDAYAHERCKHLVNTADGAAIVFFGLFGWIPAAAYTGFWELTWMFVYRRRIRQMGNTYKGRWISYGLCILSSPVWIYGFVILCMAAFLAICPSPLSPDKCIPPR